MPQDAFRAANVPERFHREISSATDFSSWRAPESVKSVGRGAAGNRRSGSEVQETVALILDTDDEIFIAADAADMAKQLVGLLYGG